MKNFAFRRYLGLAALTISLGGLSGCASSTSVVTGERRPAVAAEQVRVYTDAPSHSETIGIVRAHSVVALGDQGHLDAALTALRAEAGRLGANGVVLTRTDDQPIAYAGAGGKSGAVGIPVATPHLEARAIYVAGQ